MSDRKRKMIDGQIEKNLKRRVSYKEIPPEQKETLLEHRRLQYAARRHAFSENSQANTSNQPCASSEAQIVIPEQTASSIQDNPSTSRNAIWTDEELKIPSSTPHIRIYTP
ncbi:hypothetical protein HAX54_043124 [Datura stramonium]|uniref:Uncharacterized protein n=1 Tax=Datura stramonium TaxID=4076 RepID=A0ABS8SMQ4_DATST|nr:hypothetical protein [Datura stramonium]